MKCFLGSLFIAILTMAAALTAVASPYSDLVREVPGPARQWRSEISREQYTHLLRQKVAEIPELQQLWQAVRYADPGGEQVYFAGGALRGIMKWLEGELQSQDFKAVFKLKPPPFDTLIQAGADRDLMVLKESSAYTVFAPYNSWDVLQPKFLQASRLAGGSDIEKLGVKPDAIYDPYDSIGEYLQGRLSFTNVPEAQFASFRSNTSILTNNSKSALVLRHLRFLVMFRDVAVTESDLSLLRQIVQSDRLASPSRAEDYWITKALKKFGKECDQAGVDYAHWLSAVGLLEPLANLGYRTEREALTDGLKREARRMRIQDGSSIVDEASLIERAKQLRQFGNSSFAYSDLVRSIRGPESFVTKWTEMEEMARKENLGAATEKLAEFLFTYQAWEAIDASVASTAAEKEIAMDNLVLALRKVSLTANSSNSEALVRTLWIANARVKDYMNLAARSRRMARGEKVRGPLAVAVGAARDGTYAYFRDVFRVPQYYMLTVIGGVLLPATAWGFAIANHDFHNGFLTLATPVLAGSLMLHVSRIYKFNVLPRLIERLGPRYAATRRAAGFEAREREALAKFAKTIKSVGRDLERGLPASGPIATRCESLF